jgi:subtilisin family serine protease
VSRRNLILVVALILAATLLGPAGPVGAASPNYEDPDTQVVPQSDTGSYVVVMGADPLVVTEGADNLDTPAADARADELRAAQDQALNEAGIGEGEKINEYTVALNGFSAAISQEQAQALAARKDVAFVVPDEMRQPQTDSSPRFLGLDRRGGPWSAGITGEGVVVGVIDTGIWPEHPSFADDGSYPEPPNADVPCEFGNTAHNPDDAPFTCNNKLVGARQMLATYRALVGADPDEFDSARDDSGHGTHTASTAAGNRGVRAEVFDRSIGRISGIAPRAHVIAYKGLGNQGGFSSDLAAAIDQAVADGVDVINYSIGGGPSLIGADDIAFLFAADAGVFATTSAGNSGPDPATIGGPASVPWITSVGASTQPRFFEGRVRLGNGRTYEGASITRGLEQSPLVDAEDAGDELCTPGELDESVVSGAIVLCKRGVIGRVEKSLAVQQAGGVGMVLYEETDEGNLFSDDHWVPSVHLDNTPGLRIKSYIDNARRPVARILQWRTGTWKPAPSMTIFSSRGPDPVAEDIIKPDVTAPGMQILAGNSPFPDPGSPPGELFGAFAGTSMASPHVAGVYALLKQQHPDWTSAMARSALMTSAHQDVRDNDRRSRATPFAMGAGHIRPGEVDERGSAFQPGLVYNAAFNDYLGFLCDAAPEVFTDASATCAALEGEGVPTDAVNLNYPSIGISQLAGERTISRTVTSVADSTQRYRARVDAPPGYEVAVSPSSFEIAPGETATYEVTIRNASAPIDEWAFGSLTWSSGRRGFDVRSPIAVKAALFDAPDEVTGTGVDGSVSFDVTFGYTGDYSAAAHGLEPATLTNDTVVQDPDQTFDPADGFSNAHTFDVSGAAHFRVAIPPEATEPEADLDVYVVDPNGDLVASSTNGATDELVDIPQPADGTWTVYVHGWQTVGPDSEYTMYSWLVPATPGGNLTVDSAPASATLGETATIEASWTGATAGEWHLGAVSHSNADGVIGLTLVEVDNRGS